MKKHYIIFSDLHGNLEAWNAFTKTLPQKGCTPTIVSLGDVIGYGPNPAECFAEVNRYCGIKLLGNHEDGAFSKPLPSGLAKHVDAGWFHALHELGLQRDKIFTSRKAFEKVELEKKNIFLRFWLCEHTHLYRIKGKTKKENQQNRTLLKDWQVSHQDGRIAFFHGSPSDKAEVSQNIYLHQVCFIDRADTSNEHWISTQITNFMHEADAFAYMKEANIQIACVGHTHRSGVLRRNLETNQVERLNKACDFLIRHDDKYQYIINFGSLGLPRAPEEFGTGSFGEIEDVGPGFQVRFKQVSFDRDVVKEKYQDIKLFAYQKIFGKYYKLVREYDDQIKKHLVKKL